MRTLMLTFLMLTITTLGFAQYEFEPSADHPFGLPNPDAPQQIADFAPLIGECNCLSEARKPDGTWLDPITMTWSWKYIMNGFGVQDETLKSDGAHSGSIRQYRADSASWYVHYYSSKGSTPTLPTWEGNKTEDGKIVLYRDSKAPNGMEGDYRLTFYDISDAGYKWVGEWVDKARTIVYPTWKIDCKKVSFENNDVEKSKIIAASKAFSKAYMDADYDLMADTYTHDGKIFPGGTDIISGKEDIRARWVLKDGSTILQHEATPNELQILGDHAYDYGYYKGQSKSADGTISDWGGKYVIVWKKVNGEWKMYLDIWNSRARD